MRTLCFTFAPALFFAAEGNNKQASLHFQRSIELFPFQTSKGNAYEKLAQVYEKLGDRKAAAETLEALVKLDENNLTATKLLADYWETQANPARTLEMLQLAFFINPFEYSLHARAGEIYLSSGDFALGLREFQVALALEPRTSQKPTII
ncbi:MAG: tetratricopeptide repeat protein [Pyrinomonadaceae bacterium]